MEVQSGGSGGSGRVTFSGGGTLQLDDSVHFSGLVAGFAQPDMLDLRDIAFISGTTSANWHQLTSGSTASGTLTAMEHSSSIGRRERNFFAIAFDLANGKSAGGAFVRGRSAMGNPAVRMRAADHGRPRDGQGFGVLVQNHKRGGRKSTARQARNASQPQHGTHGKLARTTRREPRSVSASASS